jgi:hypothetical protein
VVDPGVVADLHLGQSEVGALTGVAGHDVVDDDTAMSRGNLGHVAELFFRAEPFIDPRAYPIEVSVDAGRLLAAEDAARLLQRSRMNCADADRLEGTPEILVRQRTQERIPGLRDHRHGIRREPHR